MSVAAVRRVVARLGPDEPTADADLVAALAPAGADRERAFAELVDRHGPMVLGVCRGVLADAHAAEDAFQAVFLVLARKAGTIRPPGAVGGWLYGVAVRTARKAKTAAARRQRREMAVIMSAPAEASRERPESSLDRAELRAIIDAELAALPESHRAAVVLCDLQGKTRAEAAGQLSRAEGTVAAWLSRGRKALAARLARRGVALPAAGLGAVVTPALVSAELTSAAVGAFAGRGVSPAVLALAEGVMRSLSAASTKLVAGFVVIGALLAAVATAPAWHAPDGPDAPPGVTPGAAGAPAAPDEKDKPAPGMWREVAAVEVNDLVDSVAVDAEGKRIAVGTLGAKELNTVTVFDAATRKPLWTGGPAPVGVTAVAFAPDGKTLVATRDKMTAFYAAATGDSMLMGPPFPGGHAVAFSPDGTRLAVSSGKKTTARDLPPANGEVSMGGPPDAEKNPVRLPAGVAWSADGKRLALIRHEKWDGKWPVVVWGAGSGEPMALLAGHDGTVTAVAWSKDGKLLASADEAGVIVLWDGKTLKELRRANVGTGKEKNPVHALAFSPDGKLLAAGLTLAEGKNVDRVALLDTATGKQLQAIQPLGGAPVAVAFTPDGKTLLVGCGSRDPEARKLGIDQRKKLASLRLFAADEPKPEKPLVWKEQKPLELTGWLGGSVAYSADGKVLYVGGSDGHVRAVDIATWKPLWEWAGKGHFAAIALAPDGKQLVVTTKDGALFLDAATGKPGDVLEEKGSAPIAIAYMPFDYNAPAPGPPGNKVIFGSANGYYHKTWREKTKDAATHDPNTTNFGAKLADKYAVPLASDAASKWALLASQIDRETGKNKLGASSAFDWTAKSSAGEYREIEGHKASVVCAAWSKDNTWFVTGDADGVVITWDAKRFNEKSRLALGGRVAAVALSADGTRTAAAVARPVAGEGLGAYAEEVFVWPTATAPKKPEPIFRREVGAPFSGLASVAFAPDGKSLAACFCNFAHLGRLGELTGKVRVFALKEE